MQRSKDDRLSSVSRARAAWWQYNPIENISGFVEATYLVGLRKTGMPEE
jgi:hypothetical protein